LICNGYKARNLHYRKECLNINVYLNKELVERLSPYALAAYYGLRFIMTEQVKEYYVTSELLSYYILNKLTLPRRFNEYISCGLNELIDNEYVLIIESNKKIYSLDLSSLYIDGKSQKYIEVDSNEITTIMNIDYTGKFNLLKYFILLIGTINGSIEVYIDFDSKRNIIGNMTIDYLSKITKLNRNTIMAYNNILIENNLIYVYRSNDAYLDNDDIKSLTNIYGRAKYKLYIDEFAKNQQKYKNSINYVKMNKNKSNSKRSLSQKYIALCNGKEYPKQDIIEIYLYIKSENEKYNKLNEKNNSNYYDDKIRDMTVFNKFSYLK